MDFVNTSSPGGMAERPVTLGSRAPELLTHCGDCPQTCLNSREKGSRVWGWLAPVSLCPQGAWREFWIPEEASWSCSLVGGHSLHFPAAGGQAWGALSSHPEQTPP